MSKVQTTSNTGFMAEVRKLGKRLAAVERYVSDPSLPSFSITGLSSAQIDALVFAGTKQPVDGAQIIDSTNILLLTRINGHWYRSSLTAT